MFSATSLFSLLNFKPVKKVKKWKLSFDSPATAENVWELIKRGARGEFLSGHTAAEAMEPLEKIKTAWMRAKYIGARESFISEWKPQNSIELNVIDTIVQSWFMFQHWMKVMSLRSIGEVKSEAIEYTMWRTEQMINNPGKYKQEKFDWETPSLSESEATDQAAQMVDRFHRIYCGSIRLLQSLRKNSPPQVTINNPQQVNMGEQVNVATDGGKQINMKTDE